MKTIIHLLVIILFTKLIFSQSIVIGTGSSIEVGTGSDVCAGTFGNISGNLTGNGTQCNQSLIQTFQLTVNVSNGWNMVSIPGLHPVNQNVNTWWVGKDPAAGVFRFSGGYQAVTTVVPGTGYWMKHIGARVYNTGDEWPAGGIQIVPNNPVSATAGWNLIGGYHLTVSTSGITTTPGGLITSQVFGYTPGSGYAPATNLTPGYGYWIKLTGPGNIIIPTSLAKSAPVSEYIKSNWGRIILTDAAGKNYILYSVDEEVDLTQYELPPLPPAEMFDVRYGSQRFAELIGSETQTIEMQGIEYPLTVKVEGMTIRLQDETGRIVNQLLKSGEDLVINNPQVEKLKVSSNIIPETYSLEQNYPNPFNPTTTIEFSIPEDLEDVKLTIYDALGQKVAELVNGGLEAGRYSYQWDATKLSSGLYFYQLQTNKYTSIKKMLMLK